MNTNANKFSTTFDNHENTIHLKGVVIHGRGIGKLVGTPTADIQIFSSQKFPPIGVYTSLLVWNGVSLPSVTNIGNSPTLDDTNKPSIETLILDFNKEIYGSKIELILLKFLRLPQKFPSLSDLIQQIFLDCKNTRIYFNLFSTKHYNETGKIRIDEHKRNIFYNNIEITLTTKEYEAFYLLASHPGWAYSKSQLYEYIWKEPATNCLHPVENLIYQLRKKLKHCSREASEHIVTINGYGYKFIP